MPEPGGTARSLRKIRPAVGKNKGDTIVNVSSGLGFVPAVKMPVYSASKARLHAYSMAVRQQLSKIGIKVFEVVPAVGTGLSRM
jgi:uncharacterized oxidoreductase